MLYMQVVCLKSFTMIFSICISWYLAVLWRLHIPLPTVQGIWYSIVR